MFAAVRAAINLCDVVAVAAASPRRRHGTVAASSRRHGVVAAVSSPWFATALPATGHCVLGDPQIFSDCTEHGAKQRRRSADINQLCLGRRNDTAPERLVEILAPANASSKF